MTGKKEIRFSAVNICSCLQFILVGITANVTAKVPKELTLLFESFQLIGNKHQIFSINIKTHSIPVTKYITTDGA